MVSWSPYYRTSRGDGPGRDGSVRYGAESRANPGVGMRAADACQKGMRFLKGIGVSMTTLMVVRRILPAHHYSTPELRQTTRATAHTALAHDRQSACVRRRHAPGTDIAPVRGMLVLCVVRRTNAGKNSLLQWARLALAGQVSPHCAAPAAPTNHGGAANSHPVVPAGLCRCRNRCIRTLCWAFASRRHQAVLVSGRWRRTVADSLRGHRIGRQGAAPPPHARTRTSTAQAATRMASPHVRPDAVREATGRFRICATLTRRGIGSGSQRGVHVGTALTHTKRCRPACLVHPRLQACGCSAPMRHPCAACKRHITHGRPDPLMRRCHNAFAPGEQRCVSTSLAATTIAQRHAIGQPARQSAGNQTQQAHTGMRPAPACAVQASSGAFPARCTAAATRPRPSPQASCDLGDGATQGRQTAGGPMQAGAPAPRQRPAETATNGWVKLPLNEPKAGTVKK